MVLRLALVATLAIGVAEAADTQIRTVALPPERSLALEISVGNIGIFGEPRQDAVIEVVRKGPDREALARMPVTIVETAAEVRVSAVQEGGGTDPALTAEVTLRVPQQATLSSIRLLEGRLTLTRFHGVITADVRRGSIDASDVEGTLRLETGIGNIVADRTRLSPGGLLRLRAFNGDVRLMLSERPPDARVMALALNGTIASDIALTMKDSWGPRWGETTLGKGEPVISIDVVTGAIHIRSP